ncbi:histidine phosphatase family protein [Thalassotalea sp. ND16A]|uniref:histidine phosphatase family protein n=1 Tax=Thalassotalea sp. ND16A TaxID=1535422 RepID=UPI00068C6071|nr:histidine phosphatase family protein [Thalassotalea sp. ND16A]
MTKVNSGTMTNLFLLRHAKVDGPAALYGHTDIGVSAYENDKLVAELLRVKHCFSHIVSSPLQRCRTVAEQFSEQSGLPLTIEPGLSETSFGDYDGIAFDDINGNDANASDANASDLNWPTLEKFWHNPMLNTLPNAESLMNFKQRINSILRTLISEHKGENALLICHGGVIKMMISTVLELEHNPKLFSHLRISNAHISNVSHDSVNNFSQVCWVNAPISSCNIDRQQ